MQVQEALLRFGLGGTVVSVFALIGEALKPKTFAGLFGSAPSVALATLALAYASKGPAYVALEGKTMALGAVGLVVYTAACVGIARSRLSLWLGAGLAWGIWFAVNAAVFRLFEGAIR
jgi:hypothetical protein